MPWMTFWVCALSCAVMGCPEVHRRDGLVDRAAHQDALESLPSNCSADDFRIFCANGREQSEACIRRCAEQ